MSRIMPGKKDFLAMKVNGKGIITYSAQLKTLTLTETADKNGKWPNEPA